MEELLKRGPPAFRAAKAAVVNALYATPRYGVEASREVGAKRRRVADKSTIAKQSRTGAQDAADAEAALT